MRKRGSLANPTTAASNSGEVAHMAAAAEMAKGPHLRLVWLSENINEVHGVLAELWAGYSLAVVQRRACASAAEQWQRRWSATAAAEGRREAGNEMWC